MLKNLLVTTALGGLMISSAVAQTSQPSSPSYATPPASSSSSDSMKSDTMKSDTMKSDTMKSDTKSDTMKSDTSKSSATMGTVGSTTTVTISAQKPDQFLASKVKGADVIGSDGKKIGDVSDILFDKDGKVDAFLLSVGGFLGVGAKEVALAPASLQLTQDKETWVIKVSMTKDQLAQAPNFERYKEKSTTTGSSSTTTTSSSSTMSPSANPPKNAPAANPPSANTPDKNSPATPPAPRQ